jgi:hypothetical protein
MTRAMLSSANRIAALSLSAAAYGSARPEPAVPTATIANTEAKSTASADS